MSTDPTVLHRLYLAQIGPDAIKQALTTVPPAQSKFDFRPFRDALSCCVCFTVPKHFRLLLSCVNGHLQCRDCLFYSNSGECVCFFFCVRVSEFYFYYLYFFFFQIVVVSAGLVVATLKPEACRRFWSVVPLVTKLVVFVLSLGLMAQLWLMNVVFILGVCRICPSVIPRLG